MATAADELLAVNKRRRLPLWMSSSSTPIPIPIPPTSSSTVASFPNSQQNTTTTTLGKRSSRGKLCKKVILPDQKQQQLSHHHLHPIPIPIHKQNKQLQLVVEDDDNKGFIPEPKSKPKTNNKIIINNNKPKTHEDADDVDDDEEEEELTLTVDDLIIIAQEYVNADYVKDYQQGVTTTEVESRGSTSRYESSHGIQVLSTHTYTSVGPLSNSSPTSTEIVPNSSQVGDPAQDMLDLFLGPLLKKPPTETERETYRDEEIASDNRFGKASDGEELGKQVPTLMKKKTSLKDKVAMLLD